MIARGRGQCLVGTEVRDVSERDLVYIPGMTWHQFRANAGDVLGFLCMVNAERDKPQLPDAAALDVLMVVPGVARFLKS
jgi:mannose-6-phosphate isomerase-like protein (cupin superfamily)